MGTSLAGGMAVAVLAAVLPASASASPVVPMELRGTVTLSGSSSYVREFVLKKPVRFAAKHRVVKSAGGRYSGFALRRDGDGTTATVASIVPGHCVVRGCARPAWNGTYVTDFAGGFSTVPSAPPDEARLEPGRYRLYLLTDGKPVTVRLTFPGLSGAISVTSGRPYNPVVDVPRPAQYGPDAAAAGNPGLTYSAGSSHRTRGPSTFFYYTGWKYIYGPPRSVNQYGICEFDGPPSAGPTGMYQYPCGGTQAGNFAPSGQWGTGKKAGPGGVADEYVTFGSYFGVTSDREQVSIGGFINSAVPSTGAHTMVFWLDFL